MAWIESHQEIGRHPKTRRLARDLGVSVAAAVGHLHLLWHWAMDFAEDGCLTGYDSQEVADGALWDGDPEAFATALEHSGFIESDSDGTHIHDWHDYAGKLIQRRKEDAERKRQARRKPDVPHPSEDETEPSGGRPADVRTPSNVTVPNPTVPNSTEPNRGEMTTAHARANGADAPLSSQPFALLETFCEELGQDVSVLSKSEKGKQLAAAKRLADADVSDTDVRHMTRWLRGQSWITGGIDLFTIEKQLTKWRLDGKPDQARAAPVPLRGRREAPGELSLADLKRMGGMTE